MLISGFILTSQSLFVSLLRFHYTIFGLPPQDTRSGS